MGRRQGCGQNKGCYNIHPDLYRGHFLPLSLWGSWNTSLSEDLCEGEQSHDKQVHPPRLGFRQDLMASAKMSQGSNPIAAVVQPWDQQDPIKLSSPRAVVARARNCLPE